MTPRGLSRPALAGGGLLVLLALVALASSGRGPAARDDGARAVGDGWLDVVFTLALVGMVLAVIGLVASVRVRREDDDQFTLGRMLLVALVLVALFGAIAGAAALLADRDAPPQAPQAGGGVAGGGGVPRPPVEQQEPAEARDVGISWATVLLVALAAAVLAAATVGRSRYRRLRARAREREAADAVRDVLQEAIDDLERGDPREAVIAAYARMERTLALHGLPRRAPEAPLEYTARVLTELRASTRAVRALTELFERARFSTHAISTDDRDAAVRALRDVRDDLAAAAPA